MLGHSELFFLDHGNSQIQLTAFQMGRITFEVCGQLELVDGDAKSNVGLRKDNLGKYYINFVKVSIRIYQ